MRNVQSGDDIGKRCSHKRVHQRLVKDAAAAAEALLSTELFSLDCVSAVICSKNVSSLSVYEPEEYYHIGTHWRV